MRHITIYTDGAARGNPGPSASGFMAYENDRMIHGHSEYNGKATNNFAEYKAILIALKWCESKYELGQLSITLYSDNELVVRQLNGTYRVKSLPLSALNREISKISRRLHSTEFLNVRRENPRIAAVDKSLNILLDKVASSPDESL